jgi:hypothetical protein
MVSIFKNRHFWRVKERQTTFFSLKNQAVTTGMSKLDGHAEKCNFCQKY